MTSSVIGEIWWLIVSIGILVTFHEFGHFVVARFFGVYVLRFSVGFGKPLLKHVGRDGTEFVVSAIPLGGYVKMLDEREFDVDPADSHQAFNRKPIWQRMAIAAAGPAANFLLCFVLFWAMFVIGQPDYQPIVGRAEGPAAQAGFIPGDRLQRIDGERVDTWTGATTLLMVAEMNRRQVTVEVTHEDGGHAIRTLDLRQLPVDNDETDPFERIGLVEKQFMAPAVVKDVPPEGAVGALAAGDRITAVDGLSVADRAQLTARIRTQARPATPLHLTVERAGKTIQVDVVPKMRDPQDGGKPKLTIGVNLARSSPVYDGIRRYGPVEALGASAREMKSQIEATYGLVKGMFAQGTTQGLSGPVGIAQAANESAQLGIAWFLFFLAVLSLSLGIVNLLPVPILDGGHLLYYLIELVKGSPVSERSLAVGQYIGLTLLGGLMCVAFYNDLLRHVS
jgi:regulator of sigma E protease